MKTILRLFYKTILFILLTVLTQIGGISFLVSSIVSKKLKWQYKFKPYIAFIISYSIFTFVITPIIAPIFGREKVQHTKKIQPASYATLLLNRNYVKPKLNKLLQKTAQNLKNTNITIHYLDANFPFVDKFPLLPHLSHNDGKKIDLSLIYETRKGQISTQLKSRSGYGVFEKPTLTEKNQIKTCVDKGYFQYDYPQYFTFGSINEDLFFSNKGTKQLISAILKNSNLEKLFIEPHLKQRLQLMDDRIRYHGCRSVRHDDHIHIQLK